MDDIIDISKEVTLPKAKSEEPSCYAFSLHKSGSTLLFNMLHDLAPHVSLTYFSMPDILFSKGITTESMLGNVSGYFGKKGFLYAGFRFYPVNYNIQNIREHKKILLVRNPLDALVSLYFSNKKSHELPKSGRLRAEWLKKREVVESLDVNEYVLSICEPHLNRMKSYVPFVRCENFKLYRYEDIIYEKRVFLADICQYFKWDVEGDLVKKIADKYDEFPDVENDNSHVRQVHPDNYKKYLTDETQTILKEKFKQILIDFGYTHG